jgi:hypothetical protein
MKKILKDTVCEKTKMKNFELLRKGKPKVEIEKIIELEKPRSRKLIRAEFVFTAGEKLIEID